MHRIYSNYTDEEFNTIEEEANKAGMTISAFCKAAVIAKVSGKTDNFSIDLIKILHKKLKSLDEGEVFIVSDLYSEEVWTSRSEKNTISKQLAKTVRENTNLYAVNDILPGKITQYKKLSDK